MDDKRLTGNEASTVRRQAATAGILLLLVSAAAMGIVQQRSSQTVPSQPPPVAIPSPQNSPEASKVAPPSIATAPEQPEESLVDRLQGSWKLERYGERVLTVCDDGTASADVRLNMLGALLYGDRLQLELDWSLEEGVMTQTIRTGTPAEAVGRLINDWGDTKEYRIVEVTDEQLVLDDLADGDREVWTRVGVNASSAEREMTEPKTPR